MTARDPDRTALLLALGMAAALGGSGVIHLVAPEVFVSTVPPPLPATPTVVASGVVELACATTLLVPRTRTLGGWLTAATMVAVFPANVYAALSGGYDGAPGWVSSPEAAWLRLPLQVPLVWVGLRIARGSWGAGGGAPATPSGAGRAGSGTGGGGGSGLRRRPPARQTDRHDAPSRRGRAGGP